MGKLIKCHFCYLFNKITILILIITILMVLFFSLFTASSLDERVDFSIRAINYYSSLYEIIRIISLIFVSFFFGYSFFSTQDGYHSIIIGRNVSRTKYLLSKKILLLNIFIFVYLIEITIMIIIGLMYHIVMDLNMLKSFISLFLLLMIYGNYSVLLVLLFNNIYIVFIIIPISLINFNKNIYFLSLVFPLEDRSTGISSFFLPSWYYVILFLFTSIITIVFWNRLDLPH